MSGGKMNAEQTPNQLKSFGSGTGIADSAVKDTVSYLAMSFTAFLLSLTGLILTGLAWIFLGLSWFTGKLSEWSFHGIIVLHTAVARVRWREEAESAEEDAKEVDL